MNSVKMVGIVAGVALVLGGLVIGSQFFAGTTKGVSADRVIYEDLPPQLVVSKDDYTRALQLLDAYDAAFALAEKNQVIGELKELLVSVSQ